MVLVVRGRWRAESIRFLISPRDTWHQHSDFSCKNLSRFTPSQSTLSQLGSVQCPPLELATKTQRERRDQSRDNRTLSLSPLKNAQKIALLFQSHQEKKTQKLIWEKINQRSEEQAPAEPSRWQIWGKWIDYLILTNVWSLLSVNSRLYEMQLWHFFLIIYKNNWMIM